MTRFRLPAAVLLFFFISHSSALAVNPDEVLEDHALETRARQISSELRCLVCQNQSIDISDADLAKDLRVIVRERLTAGDSDKQVLDFVVARYGEFVLLKPSFSAGNAILWGAPLLVVLVGALVLFRQSRKNPQASAARPLSPEEERRLGEIMTDRTKV
jgi:cytochrome c-type biogenesis protein CcmH